MEGIHLPHAGGHAGHALLCHQEEQSLGGVQRNFIPGGENVKGECEGEETGSKRLEKSENEAAVSHRLIT